MVSLSHPFPSLPPFAEDKQGGRARASSPAGGRGDRVCSHYSKRGVSQSTGDNLSRLPPRRRCKEQEKVRKEGRKEGRKQRVLSPFKLQSLPRSYMDAGKGEICE